MLTDHISQEYDTGHAFSKAGELGVLCNYDLNKMDFFHLQFELGEQYLGCLTFSEGENTCVGSTIPRIYRLLRTFITGDDSDHVSTARPQRLFDLLTEKASTSHGQFRVSTEEHFDDEGINYSYIYQVALFFNGGRYFLAYQTTPESEPLFLGELQIPDVKVLDLMKQGIVENRALRFFHFLFEEDQVRHLEEDPDRPYRHY